MLKELEQLAVVHPEGFPNLNYTQAQQALTLYSLLTYFRNRGIELPFELELTLDDPGTA